MEQPPLNEEMFCDICGSETKVRYDIDLQRNIWCCSNCFKIYRSIYAHYSEKGYTRERCISILRGVVFKQLRSGQRK